MDDDKELGQSKSTPEEMRSDAERADDGSKEYETRHKKGYSEFNDDHGLDSWGNIGVDGKWLNYYTSPEIIRNEFTHHVIQEVEKKPFLKQGMTIMDVGGGDGYLLNKVIEQMEAAGVTNIKGFDIDLDPSGKALPVLREKVASGEYSPAVHPIKADVLTGIPLEPESVDVAISRFAIQYVTRDKHLTFLKNIATVLKPGGILVVEFPGLGSSEIYNTVMSQISMIINDGKEFQRDFPSPEIFFHGDPEDEVFPSETGLKLRLGSERTPMPFSANSWGDRFKLDEWKMESIRELYKNVQQEFPEVMEVVDGVLCLRNYVYQYKFEKVATITG